MAVQETAFLDFLRFCIDDNIEIPNSLEGVDWQYIFDIAAKQAILGVTFYGLKRLPKELLPEKNLLMKWFAVAEKIKKSNEHLNSRCVQVAIYFEKAGFRNCILKGQGNAILYPDSFMRTPGDIDIWLQGGKKKIMSYVDYICPGQVVRYHHMDFPICKDVMIEVHFTPSYMYNPINNRTLQRWFQSEEKKQFGNSVTLSDGNSIYVPQIQFNLVYILSHLYRHLFSEGIGLRQLLDYYYMLKQDESSKDRQEATRLIKYLGMGKFLSAVMWLMHEVFGLEEKFMLCNPNEKEGHFLLKEVMIGGNFGKYDSRLGDKEKEGMIRRYFRMTVRNMRYVIHYPSEALCEPIFRTLMFFRRNSFR